MVPTHLPRPKFIWQSYNAVWFTSNQSVCKNTTLLSNRGFVTAHLAQTASIKPFERTEMNTNQRTSKNVNATVSHPLADAVARGYVKKLPTGYFATIGGQAITGDTVKVKQATGEVVA